VQKFSDPPLTACPECGGGLKKLISATSFVLKGSGWHVSDYPSADRKKAVESAKESSGEKKKADKKEKKVETAKTQ
jgi:predicted nucleic acid-binding Zn ribbon protein